MRGDDAQVGIEAESADLLLYSRAAKIRSTGVTLGVDHDVRRP